MRRLRWKSAHVLALTVAAMGASSLLLAQGQPESSLAFDVASIRQNLSGEDAGGPNQPRVNFPIGSDDAFTDTHGEFSAINMPLDSYLIFAYKITNNNRQALLDSVPGWVTDEHFDIEARTDRQNVTKDEMRLMMQQLLAARFKVTFHDETRQVKVFAATLTKARTTGPQLRSHEAAAPCAEGTLQQATKSSPSQGPSLDAKGFPLVCGRFANYLPPTTAGNRRVGGGDLTLPAILSSFTGLGSLGRPVIDRTGLTGRFDFVLEYLPEPPPGAEEAPDTAGLPFIAAVRSQLGIKLVTGKAPIPFVLIDHIEQPSEN